MSYGLSFIDMLVSEATMILACIVFVIGVGALVFFRKRLSTGIKIILAIILTVTFIYLMFIAWLVIGFGRY